MSEEDYDDDYEEDEKVSKEFIEEVTGAYSEDDFECGGWRHSAVC